MSKIKPCPFCGGSAEIREFDHRHPYEPFGLVVAHSDDCFLNFPRDETTIHAAWDVRPVEDELSASLNRASDACASVQKERDELRETLFELRRNNRAGVSGAQARKTWAKVNTFLARHEGGPT